MIRNHIPYNKVILMTPQEFKMFEDIPYTEVNIFKQNISFDDLEIFKHSPLNVSYTNFDSLENLYFYKLFRKFFKDILNRESVKIRKKGFDPYPVIINTNFVLVVEDLPDYYVVKKPYFERLTPSQQSTVTDSQPLIDEVESSITFEKSRELTQTDIMNGWTHDYKEGYIDGMTNALDIIKSSLK